MSLQLEAPGGGDSLQFRFERWVEKVCNFPATWAGDVVVMLSKWECEFDEAVAGTVRDVDFQEQFDGAMDCCLVVIVPKFFYEVNNLAWPEILQSNVDIIAGLGATDAAKAEFGMEAFGGMHSGRECSIFLPIIGRNSLPSRTRAPC